MLSKDMNNQENQKKQNGSRRYSVLLLALLFIGMATYGTYAYFTDSTSVNGNIKLSTGTVSLTQSPKEWVYNEQGVNKVIGEGPSALEFTNVQPGDSFTKEVTVQYEGTLDGIVTVNQFTNKELQEDLEYLDYKILVDGEEIDPEKKIPVGKDKLFNVTLEVTIPLLEEEYTDERQGEVFNLDELAEAVTFSVTQTGLE